MYGKVDTLRKGVGYEPTGGFGALIPSQKYIIPSQKYIWALQVCTWFKDCNDRPSSA